MLKHETHRIAGQAEQWGAVKSKKQSSKPASSSVNPAVPAVVAAAQVVVDLEAEPGTTPAAISHPPTRGGGFVGRGGAGRGRGGASLLCFYSTTLFHTDIYN